MKVLDKIDYLLSGKTSSRPESQVLLIVRKLYVFNKKRVVKTILDIGGGERAEYKVILSSIAKQYINLDIKKGSRVDIVGSAYEIPLKTAFVDLATLFMVLEHLNRPLEALEECNRVLKRGGHLAITTVQYWHTHNHPSDYFRYTQAGLEYLLKEAGFKIVDIWSIGGPFLVVFHAIELNLPGAWRTMFSILFYRFFDWLDWVVFKHEDRRKYSDSVGWSLIARKI